MIRVLFGVIMLSKDDTVLGVPFMTHGSETPEAFRDHAVADCPEALRLVNKGWVVRDVCVNETDPVYRERLAEALRPGMPAGVCG